MTTATKPKISIAASIQADQEPRRFRELRAALAAERDGAVCPLCRYRISDTAIMARDYQFADSGEPAHNICRDIQLICTGRAEQVVDRPGPPDTEGRMDACLEPTPGRFNLKGYEEGGRRHNMTAPSGATAPIGAWRGQSA